LRTSSTRTAGGGASRLGVVQGLQRGRGTAQQHRHVERLAAHQGEVAGVVADAVLLLVAAVVLLVDHDQPGLGQRHEHRRARADDHPGLAAPGGGPDPGALAVGQTRVQRVHRHAEAAAEALQGLRGQADLGHQHQRLLPRRQAIGDGVQVDLGLAAAGDAVEQRGREAAARAQAVPRGVLFFVQGRARVGHRCGLRRRHGDAFGQAALEQGARGRAPVVEAGVEQVFVEAVVTQQFGQPRRTAAQALAGGLGHQPPGPGVGVGQGLAVAQQGRQGRGEDLAERSVGVARQPAQRVQQLALQQGQRVEGGFGLAQLAQAGIARADLRDHADQAAAAERHPHTAADHAGPVGRRQVVEQAGQRQRKRHPEHGIGSVHGRQSTARPGSPGCRPGDHPHSLWISMCMSVWALRSTPLKTRPSVKMAKL
jgi:hypothetical protein